MRQSLETFHEFLDGMGQVKDFLDDLIRFRSQVRDLLIDVETGSLAPADAIVRLTRIYMESTDAKA